MSAQTEHNLSYKQLVNLLTIWQKLKLHKTMVTKFKAPNSRLTAPTEPICGLKFVASIKFCYTPKYLRQNNLCARCRNDVISSYYKSNF